MNKRTSRIAANIPFIKSNLCPLSFVDVPQETYVEATIAIYERKEVVKPPGFIGAVLSEEMSGPRAPSLFGITARHLRFFSTTSDNHTTLFAAYAPFFWSHYL